MYLWGFLCFLSAFATTGDGLLCVTCSTDVSDSCSATTGANCSVGEVCATQNMITRTNFAFSQSSKRFCAPPSECSVIGTFTRYNTSERIATMCCAEDLCTPLMPQVPIVKPEPNGVMCPKCSMPTDLCGTDQNQICTGDQTMCVIVSKTITRGPQTEVTTTRGCASIGYCMRNNMNATIDGVYLETTYQCTKGTLSGNISNPSSTTTTAATTTAATTTRASILSENNGTSRRSYSLSAVVSLFLLFMLI